MCGYFSIWFIDFMFAGKILTDFVGLFSPYDFEKIHSIILISKMNEIDRTNLNDQAKFILNEISKTENYSNQEKIHSIILISKMNEIDRTNLNDQAKFILNEISKTENYSNQEINQRKRCSKKLSKYVVTFDYIDKVWIVLSATSGRVLIVSSVGVVEAPIEIAGASFTLMFSLTTGIIKKLLSIEETAW